MILYYSNQSSVTLFILLGALPLNFLRVKTTLSNLFASCLAPAYLLNLDNSTNLNFAEAGNI